MSTIRPLRADDATPLAAQLAELPLLVRYGTTAAKLVASLERALDRGDQVIVYDDEGPAGFAWFMPSGTFALGGYLRLIAVAPRAQRTGAGSTLLAEFERVTARRCAHAFLLVSDFNGDAQRFYERHGYRRSGALPGLVLPDVTELVYWKRVVSSTPG